MTDSHAVQAQHSEYEHEIQKSENVLKHYRDRIQDIQNIIGNLESKVSLPASTYMYVIYHPEMWIVYSCLRQRRWLNKQQKRLVRYVYTASPLNCAKCLLVRLLMSKVCERIETRRNRKSIETEISKLKRHIQREEPQIDEKEAVAQEYTTKIDLYRKTMKAVREHKLALKVRSTW